MSNIKCGIQLFTLRDYCKTIEDIEATLKKLHEHGVRNIQISGIGKVDWNELAEIVKKYEMDVCVTHTSFERMMSETDAVIDEHLKLGCDCLGIGCMPGEYERTEEGVDKFIADLIPVAKRMRERGVHLAYHNHDFDLKLYGGKSILDRMLELDKDLLWFVPDVAWIQIAGENPAEYLKKMQDRVKVLHFKDYNPVEDGEHPWAFTELGKGVVDLKACYETAKEMGIPYIMFEQDNNWTVNAMESSKESFEFMTKLS
ncbi:MAG: sugar phosphate isomerase/epimerase [Clostridia bacterium]|nr:sugar phosphate isomerase/epimerase [Clostridia bacterium]